jgi:hypothetical protein
MSLRFRRTTPVAIIRIEAIFSKLTGSLKYVMPIKETNIIPIPAQIAYIKLKSKCLRANINMLKAMPQKTNVNIDAYKFENPFDNFIQVDPPSSDNIATVNNIQRILIS